MKRLTNPIFSFFALSLIIFCPKAHTFETLTHHLLLKPYEGSTFYQKNVQDFDEYNAFLGMDPTGETSLSQALKGKVSKFSYFHPKGRSIFEVFQNYKLALDQAGAKLVYQCEQKKQECAKRNLVLSTFEKLNNIHSIRGLLGSYLLAKMEKAGNTAYIAIAVGEKFTDIHIIEISKMDKGMVTLDANALGSCLDSDGYVVVPGIYFDTNNATVQEKSKPALAQIAELLTSRTEMKIYIVGHTDMQGSFENNLELSQKRANSVLEMLVTQYGIAPSRMDAQGLGPLAPEASNSNEKGRSKNRRVVIVVR